MGKPNINALIADAIQKADNSYFFENYSKQAQAVLHALSRAGYQIIPGELTDELIKEVTQKMRMGRVKPEDHVRHLLETAFSLMKNS